VSSAALSTSLPRLLLRLAHHMGRRRQRQFLLLICLMLVGTVAEVVSLGAVLPFLAILTVPERALRNHLIAHVAQALHVTTPAGLVLPLTLAFVSAAVLSAAIRIAQLSASMRFAFVSGADVSHEVYRRTLYQPYWVQVSRGSDEIISGIKIGRASCRERV
jgi:ATP-binding cassette subfamily B protein